MFLDNDSLCEALNSVIAIPIIPFSDRGEEIDFRAHERNIDYLMQHNYLSDDRPRVIALAGTSLIHHLTPDDQIQIMDVTGRLMGDQEVLISGVVPNPLPMTANIIKAQARLPRPPDAYLIMPLGGIYSPGGLYERYMAFAERVGSEHGARLLFYMRKSAEREIVIRLIRDSPHFIGVKVGTSEADVQPLIEGIAGQGMVIWGVGDRATDAAELGATGHTSGIAVVAARASDEINNAHRIQDYATARQIEAKIDVLETLRFMNDRIYNYSAVVEAMHLLGVPDISGGSGGPFNPRVPPEIARQVADAIQDLKEYH